MNVSEFVVNVKNPSGVVKNIKSFLDKPEVQTVIENNDFSELEKTLVWSGLGWQGIGLLWAILRDILGEDTLYNNQDHIPAGFYAYNNIKSKIDLSGYNIGWIGADAFYKSTLSDIVIPKTCSTFYSQASFWYYYIA